jgi:hypothetical protein
MAIETHKKDGLIQYLPVHMTFTIGKDFKTNIDRDAEIELELEHRMSRWGLNPCGR